jgi:hypothetical protein
VVTLILESHINLLPPKEQDLGERLPLNLKSGSTSKDERRETAIKFVKEKVLGGEDRKVFEIECGGLKEKLVISAEGYGGHSAEDIGRLSYLGYLPDILKPQEVWADFLVSVNAKQEMNKLGQLVSVRRRRSPMALRFTAVTRINHTKYEGLILVYQNNGNGEMALYTFFPVKKVNAYRKGQMIAAS